ncbi:hypothetical protein [Streptomyces sp. NRRL S-1868]|nr:hypothetical protein [Streptomyces sp. NRRL S-1868]
MTDPNPNYADACPRCLAGPVRPGSGIAARGSLTAATGITTAAPALEEAA